MSDYAYTYAINELIANNNERITTDNYSEIDGIILSEFSGKVKDYFLYNENELSLDFICDRILLKYKGRDPSSLDGSDRSLYELAIALKSSGRYDKVTITNPLNTELEESADKGKSYHTDVKAATYHLNDEKNTIIIAFAGTGAQICSWIEDYRLAYINPQAQLQSSDYFNEVAETYKDSGIIAAGYSKGGNMMAYATLKNYEKFADRYIRLDNFDGPGFSDGTLYNEDGSLTEFGEKYFKYFEEYKKKLTCYSPYNSFVGHLMNDWEEYTYFGDNDSLFPANHDFHNWTLDPNGSYTFEHKADNSVLSKYLNKYLDGALSTFSVEDKRDFANWIEEFCHENEIVYLQDMKPSHIYKFVEFFLHNPNKNVYKTLVELVNPVNIAGLLAAYEVDHPGDLLKLNIINPVGGAFTINTFLSMAVTGLVAIVIGVCLTVAVLKIVLEEISKLIHHIQEGITLIEQTIELLINQSADFIDKIKENALEIAQKVIDRAEDTFLAFWDRVEQAVHDNMLAVIGVVIPNSISRINAIIQSIKLAVRKISFSSVRATIANMIASVSRKAFTIDISVVREGFERLTRVVNRMKSLEHSLDNLYRMLSNDNETIDEKVISLVNKYHLLRSDINVSYSYQVGMARRRLYALITLYENKEKSMEALANNLCR